MTPEEAEKIMDPFFPSDPNLAGKALSRALNKGTIPDWIVESLVADYFTFLSIDNLRKFVRQYDPFGWDTVPYVGYIDRDNKN